jgi:alpha-glucosidase
MLTLYRNAIGLRRKLPALGDGHLTGIDADEDVLAFRREPGFVCVVNVREEPADSPREVLDGAADVLLTSGPTDADGRIPGSTAMWYAAG